MATEEAKQEIQRLVAKYEGLSTRTIKGYNEANTKDGFIRPVFEALGWDFSNLDEVEGEKTITPGRVDYLFKVNGVSKFCLEVKALHVDINDERWIRQAITYAYYKGVTWAVLTNFKALRAFNAERETMDIRQVAFLNLTCEDYLTDFHRLWLLSREAVDSGDLDKEAVAYGRLPPRLPVEKRLYDKLIGWREALFNDVYLHYKEEGFTWSQMDQRIQQLLNRLIFIRTAEDRGLIDRKLLAALHQWRGSSKKGDLMDRLRDIFHEFANLYDSDLFPQIMDPWDLISVKNSWVLADIIQGLYEVPGGLADWDFATIGSDVLGTVYEQYLGYVPAQVKKEAKEAQQRLFPTEPHIGITAKKEKRKGEGIYYTPPWVVDYIVKQTVGRFIAEHSYNDILSIKVLDPACGSGSFLTRAYEELLDYHARQQGKSPADLDQSERTRILLRNIYGVDLDQQAIEIAHLSLLLCSLSGQETLPSLANNIRRGNSLISGTEAELRSYFGDQWEEKHRFNWDDEFPQIMKDGRFDVVIGNPPYVGFHGFKEEKDYFRNVYETCEGRFDLYLPFIEKGIRLLKEGGLLGFICPTNFTKRQHGKTLRKFLKGNCKILQIVDFGGQQVFEQALNYTGVFIFEKSKPTSQHYLVYIRERIDGECFPVQQAVLQDGGWTFRDKISEQIVAKIEAQPNTLLGDLTESISEGIVTGKNQVFLLPLGKADELRLENELLKPVVQGKQIHRFFHEPAQNVVIYPYRSREERAQCIVEEDLSRLFPVTWEYLSSHRQNLAGRDYFNESAKAWYELWCERSFLQQASNKIIVPELASNNRFAYCEASTFYLDTVCGLLPKNKDFKTYLYLLGLLNSSLLEFYYKKTTVPKAGGFYIYKTMFLKKLPIRHINFGKSIEKKLHDDLVALVERMLVLNKRLAPIRNTFCNELDELMREIKRTDRQIDNLVYDLYGLTEEERTIVEEST